MGDPVAKTFPFHTKASYRFEAVDGFSISLAANDGAYCKPREDLWVVEKPNYNFLHLGNKPPEMEDLFARGYTHIELGFPSRPVPTLTNFKEGDEPDEDSVYPYTDVITFLWFMTTHGGIIREQWSYLPPMAVPHEEIISALDPSGWKDWDSLNWQVIPAVCLTSQ